MPFFKKQNNQLVNYSEANGDTVPIGIIQPFAGATIPDGYLLCDGRAISRTSYAELFAAIGTTWGAGDGSTTFNIPDLREVAPVGVGQSERTEGSHDVFTLGEFKDDQMQSHKHSYIRYKKDDGNSGPSASNHLYGGLEQNTGDNSGRSGDVTRGKRIGVNYIIKYRMVNGSIDDPVDADKIAYDNTASGLTATNVQDAVDEINNDLSKNNLPTVVGLGSYTESSPYIAPSDGYVECHNSSATKGYVKIEGADSNQHIWIGSELNAGFWSVFVKKGMKLSVITGYVPYEAKFYPLS